MASYSDYVATTQKEYTNPSTFKLDTGKYDINTTTYPSDLGAPDLAHFVLFNINVKGKSVLDPKLATYTLLNEIIRGRDSANMTKEQISSPVIRGITEVTAGVTAGVAATALVNRASEAVFKSGSKSAEVASTAGKVIGAGVALAVGGAMAASDVLKPDKTFRITDAIALYMDAPPTVKYNMNYANKDLGTLLGVLSGSVFDSNGLSAGSAEAAAAMGASLAKLPGAFGGADVASALSVSSGTALNPFKEVVFESVDFRSFAFKYKFFPKSQGEADSVYNIIKTFKEHMHPTLNNDSKLFFIYPSEFQITYYFKGGPNPYFHKFKPCVLESLDVSYGGDQFSSFADGKPAEIHLSMTFKENEILTRDSIRDGY
jgi:hypothetical protein